MSLTSILILLPLLAGLLVLCCGRALEQRVKPAAVLLSLLPLLVLVLGAAQSGAVWSESVPVLPLLGIDYKVTMDDTARVLTLLACLVTPFALLVTDGYKLGALHASLYLFLQGALIGCFTAVNFGPWFLFWELALVPAYFLVKLHGGEGREAASTQFFLYTMAGSALMLGGMTAVYLATGSWDFGTLAGLASSGELAKALSGSFGSWAPSLVFFLVFAGVAVKIPVFPFHTWLPATYASAPGSATMMLTGVMSKMGVCGLLRLLLPLFPGQLVEWQGLLVALALGGILAGAFAALAQSDIKRMLAYSSINHLGYVALALFASVSPDAGANAARAVTAAMLQVFNHGVIAATLFACVAFLEARSGGLRGMADFGGLRARMPVFASFMGIALFASLGLPGLGGFVAEFLVFKAVFGIEPLWAVLAAPALLVTAIFLLGFWKRVFHGPANPRWEGMADLNWGERTVLAGFLALIVLMGVWPQCILNIINPAARMLAQS